MSPPPKKVYSPPDRPQPPAIRPRCLRTTRRPAALRGYVAESTASGEHEELVTAWLWSDAQGVLSHQTALSLHGLSDVLPAQIHLTLPLSWRRRRFRVPRGFVLHHADVPRGERTWVGAVPVTSVRRTLNDCAIVGLSPDLLRQGAKQALARGLVTKAEMGAVQKALKAFGGLRG